MATLTHEQRREIAEEFAPGFTADELRKLCPVPVAEIAAGARDDGVQAERARLRLFAGATEDAALALACAVGGKELDQLKVLDAERKVAELTRLRVEVETAKAEVARLQAFNADGESATHAEVHDGLARAVSTLPPAEQEAAMRQQFAVNPELQKEYGGDANAYVAYMKANAKGQVRRLTKERTGTKE